MMETVLLLQIVVMLWGSGLGASISPEFYKRVITLPNRVFNGVSGLLCSFLKVLVKRYL